MTARGHVQETCERHRSIQHAAILSYHQVDAPPRDAARDTLVLPPWKFDVQLSILHALGWKGLSLRDLRPYLDGRATGRVFGITLDDGYRNNLTRALPILQRLGFTATLFMVSGQVGGSNVWDQGHLPASALMDLPELEAWVGAGMEVGAHTRSHPRLVACDSATARAEIAGSKADLEDALGIPVEHFSYPHGLYVPAHVEMVREAGYVGAVTTRTARACAQDDPLQLPRLSVHSTTSIPRLVMQVTTGFEEWRAERRKARSPIVSTQTSFDRR
ncbi:polysaccharide deacetylase family protein [Ramlibacter sp. MMS24-I3-19]|uniref:polysaccharide deacetylase family protein n=1 Tax=Ramlibacter sp. MMS24-I3-19 TaxID=3416606 RepID=UPI003D002440